MLRPGEGNGQTLGKQLLGIRVVRDDGEPVGLGTALGRDLVAKPALGILTLGLDFLWPLGERERRALHDKAARTHVFIGLPELPPPLSPALARYVHEARAIEESVRQARTPYRDVAREVSELAAYIEDSARRAQPLYSALAQRPVAEIERRLAEAEGKPELVEALRTQLPIQRRMQAQLERYFDHLERVVVELDTVRAGLLTVAASTDDHDLLAERVRDLRDEMVAASEGFSEAYGG